MHTYSYFTHADLLTLAASIADWTDRMDFFHSIVDNDYNHYTLFEKFLVRVRIGDDSPDYAAILALEKAAGFTCGRLDPPPTDG